MDEPNITIVNVEYNTKFTLKDSLRKNTGIYKIVAENVHGKDEAEVEVVVLGKLINSISYFWITRQPVTAI